MNMRSNLGRSAATALAVASLALLSTSCAGSPAALPKAAPSFPGSYAGIIPAASCPGIELRIDIGEDLRWTSSMAYLDREGGPYIDGGLVELNGDSGLALLRGASEASFRLRLEPAGVRLLDAQGRAVDGELADAYVLDRLDASASPGHPGGVDWILVQLDGKPVAPAEGGKAPTLNLDLGLSMASGTGSCNRYTGGFSFSGLYGLRFSALATTKMACPDMGLETRYYWMLDKVRAYRIADGRLHLYAERGAPLAIFESY